MSCVECGLEAPAPIDCDLKRLPNVSHRDRTNQLYPVLFEAFALQIADGLSFESCETALQHLSVQDGCLCHYCARIILDHIAEKNPERRKRPWRTRDDNSTDA